MGLIVHGFLRQWSQSSGPGRLDQQNNQASNKHKDNVSPRTSWRTVVSDWRDLTSSHESSSGDFWRLGWRDFFVPTVLLSTFIPFFLTSSPLSLIVLFQSCCSHAQVFARTLVHEFLFSYSHTEWNLLFVKQTPLWHEATLDKPKASIKTETGGEEDVSPNTM